MDNSTYMDQSGLYAMEDVVIDLVNNGKKICLVHLDEQPKYMMERVDIIPDLIPESQIFDNFDNCLTWIKANVEDIYPIDKDTNGLSNRSSPVSA